MLKGMWLLKSLFLNIYSNKVWRFKYNFIPLRCINLERYLKENRIIRLINICQLHCIARDRNK